MLFRRRRVCTYGRQPRSLLYMYAFFVFCNDYVRGNHFRKVIHNQMCIDFDGCTSPFLNENQASLMYTLNFGMMFRFPSGQHTAFLTLSPDTRLCQGS